MKLPHTESLGFIEELWNQYQDNPDSIGADWRAYFDELQNRNLLGDEDPVFLGIGRGQLLEGRGPGGDKCKACGRVPAMSEFQHRVDALIRAYRVRGHLAAKLDPWGRAPMDVAELRPEHYGLTSADMELRFSGGPLSKSGKLRLREIVDRLESTYCDAIGIQFMHIESIAKREWLQSRIESTANRIELSRADQVRILTRLTDAVVFEQFIQRKFVGAKSFSLEGAESLIPLLDTVIEKAGRLGIEQIIIGMPHRGRLNVLANIMGKHPRKIFREFRDELPETEPDASDVKYHMGYHSDHVTSDECPIHMDLMFNPSHLEFVGPVAQGALRAEQDLLKDIKRNRSLLILIHGDASMAGQGIVQETLNLSNLDGYGVGGTLHIIVNNQIGFTTLSAEGRSSRYASDVARMLPIPIFHINGEHPDAVAQAVRLSMDFRNEFRSDVVLDMLCYRRFGHNESDDPTVTQPVMYQRIKNNPNVQTAYMKRLLKLGELTRKEAARIRDERLAYLENEFRSKGEMDEENYSATPNAFEPKWETYRKNADPNQSGTRFEVDTTWPATDLSALLQEMTTLPESFVPHKRIVKFLIARSEMADGKQPIDWGNGEALALATLAKTGTRIRLSGQDAQRGTFTHRHGVLHDAKTGQVYMPLSNLSPSQAPVELINSPLSEGAALGFEYGYSTVDPESLVIWEAQFGDFANVAQVYIDQFISSGQSKWALLSGLVLFLPHGLEGTGPEHASARLERFLSLSGQGNWCVVQPTTPAQMFHLLRRQILAPIRRPLIAMTPKSMLRKAESFSVLSDLSDGHFREIIGDSTVPLETARRVILCSGKIYYDLIAHRKAEKIEDMAVIRLEQLYPLNRSDLLSHLDPYPEGRPVVWVQEEPRNMGALSYMHLCFASDIERRWPYHEISRNLASSPATGSAAIHRREQQDLLYRAFGPPENEEKTK